MNAWSVVRVTAEKGGSHAMFGVNVHRTPYFFRDRDIELTESGVRKRIFHQVRPYLRKDGTAVKLHFRGQRRFTWAGYNITITVPGRHHFMTEEFDIGVVSGEWKTPDVEYCNEPEVGRKLRKIINGESPKSQFV